MNPAMRGDRRMKGESRVMGEQLGRRGRIGPGMKVAGMVVLKRDAAPRDLLKGPGVLGGPVGARVVALHLNSKVLWG